jgi:dTDP-4-dehydrorhamnose reductase
VRILLTGRGGQVGTELEGRLQALGEVMATDRTRLDITNASQVARVMREWAPHVVINAAGHTFVDRAEQQAEVAFQANAAAPGVLGEEARRTGAWLVHFSSDYVFDGRKRAPYREDDEPHPLNAYGRSKLEGDRAVARSGCRYLILRSGWLYAAQGRNFLLTMRRLAAEGRSLQVVDDQVGAPTPAGLLAEAACRMLERVMAEKAAPGLYHVACGGSTSWHGFARAILDRLGMNAQLTAINSAQYGALASRPGYSVLDSGLASFRFGITLPPWEYGLDAVIAQVRKSGSSQAQDLR